MMVWKMMFLFNWVIFRFRVNLPGCNCMVGVLFQENQCFTPNDVKQNGLAEESCSWTDCFQFVSLKSPSKPLIEANQREHRWFNLKILMKSLYHPYFKGSMILTVFPKTVSTNIFLVCCLRFLSQYSYECVYIYIYVSLFSAWDISIFTVYELFVDYRLASGRFGLWLYTFSDGFRVSKLPMWYILFPMLRNWFAGECWYWSFGLQEVVFCFGFVGVRILEGMNGVLSHHRLFSNAPIATGHLRWSISTKLIRMDHCPVKHGWIFRFRSLHPRLISLDSRPRWTWKKNWPAAWCGTCY